MNLRKHRRMKVTPYRWQPGFDRLHILPAIMIFPKIEYPTTLPDIEWHSRSIDFRFLFWGLTVSIGKAIRKGQK